jgi:hypothetical protein
MRTRSGLLGGCVVLVHAAAWGQTYDTLDLLHRVSANVTGKLGPIGSSGAYRCRLTLERSQYRSASDEEPACDGPPKTRLVESDRVKLDVAIAAEGDTWSWPGEYGSSSEDLYDLAGSGMQTGSYSEFLSAIFGSDAADFYWIGETEVQGRKLAEFGFEVPIGRSRYAFRSGKERYATAYGGTFLADPTTSDLVRLAVRSDGLPAESGVCHAATTLEYGRSSPGARYALPDSAQLEILHSHGIESRNRLVYSACRLSGGEPETSRAPALALKAGIGFAVRLTQTLDPEKAFGGDLVKAVIEAPIRDPVLKVILVPRDTQVIARIIRLERRPDTNSLRLELRLEAIEHRGATVPLKAIAGGTGSPDPSKPRGVRVRDLPSELLGRPLTGNIEDDPGIFVWEVQNAMPGSVIKRGTVSTNWVTAGP